MIKKADLIGMTLSRWFYKGYMAIIHKRNISIVHMRSKVVYGTCKRLEKCVDRAHEAHDFGSAVVQIHWLPLATNQMVHTSAAT